jgi:hypothetical protein
MTTDREPPDRAIDKKEGVRQFIHAAIRATFAQEDPFAIHLLGQSAEKVLVDLAKRAGKDDLLFPMIRPDKRNRFFELYRESYNFLKHADEDQDGELGVYDIVAFNDILLFNCCMPFEDLFGEITHHMRTLVWFVACIFPNFLDLKVLPGLRAAVWGDGGL